MSRWAPDPQHRFVKLKIAFSTLLALLTGGAGWGCGAGDGSTLDELGRAEPYRPALASRYGAHTFPATFSAIVSEFFVPLCADCHAGTSAPRGLDLSSEDVYEELVGAPSTQRPGMELVARGAPDASYLIVKLEAAAGMTGRQMPRNRPPRPSEEIAVLRQWIAEGAPRN